MDRDRPCAEQSGGGGRRKPGNDLALFRQDTLGGAFISDDAHRTNAFSGSRPVVRNKCGSSRSVARRFSSMAAPKSSFAQNNSRSGDRRPEVDPVNRFDARVDECSIWRSIWLARRTNERAAARSWRLASGVVAGCAFVAGAGTESSARDASLFDSSRALARAFQIGALRKKTERHGVR